ncbi:MAG TPA: hypothetical protein VD931_07695 [Baekduia sp.]|nr:hypothetical protein [Baekduia sp.]
MTRVLGLLAVLFGLGALVPAAAPAVVIGIGDQKADMFRDPLFAGSAIRHARLAVSWDALHHPWQVRELDRWLAGAREAGVEPLVGFWHSRTDRRKLPTPEQLKWEFRRLRARHPWVRTFATWNEANHCGEPTCHRPRLVAAYWRALRRECRTCTILAAEVLDMPNMAGWVRAFRRHARVEPKIWGLHNYIDANRFRTSGTRALLRSTRGHVWFTETGGIVKRRTKVRVPLAESSRHAARATRWVFDRLVPLSRRVKRVYLYHWNPKGRRPSWDSALLDRRGRPRPAFLVLRRQLRVLAARRAAAARERARAAS